MQLTTTVRNNRLTQIKSALDAGGANTGKLKCYTGTAPGVGNAATGTLLCTLTALTLAIPSGGTMTVSATSDTNAAATGTPGYYRLTTSADVAIQEGPAAVAGGEASFGSTVSAGSTVSMSSGTITEGNP